MSLTMFMGDGTEARRQQVNNEKAAAIPEMLWFLVSSGSDGAMCLLVQWPDLRAAIHEAFCCCKDAACNAGGYLDDWDDYCEEQQREGAHWDLEDGWVKVEPLAVTPVFWPQPQTAAPGKWIEKAAAETQDAYQRGVLHGKTESAERIAALQAEVDALKAENAAHVHDLGHLQNVNCKLQAEVARRSAPVTDAEWAVSHWVKSGGSMRGFVDAVILARATPSDKT